MKKIIILVIAIAGITLFYSCEKERDLTQLDMSQTIAPAFVNPEAGSNFVFLQENADVVFATFSWSPAQYNLDDLEEVKYIIQADFPGDSSFYAPEEFLSTTDTFYAFSTSEMNTYLTNLGLEKEVATDVLLRLKAYINNTTEYTAVYSDSVIYNFTTYEQQTTAPSLWVPGDYQGWDPATAPRIYDHDGDGIYSGYIYFPEDAASFEFKFTSEPTWDGTNYGFTGTEGELNTDPGATNLSVPGPGGYHVEVDINALTWTGYENAPENWGVIGEWLSWEDDIDMIWYHDGETEYLYVTVEDIPAAENQRFKFRANDAWDINLGANDPDDGFLTQGGADIPIPDGGTITFYLSFSTPDPSYWIE